MDANPPSHLAELVHIAQASFDNVIATVDVTPVRSILRIVAQYGPYRIFITELADGVSRKYSYYALLGNLVEIGFDNSPDPRAIRLKYGRIGAGHAGEPTPHLHRANKTEMILTEEMTLADFVDWLKTHLPLSGDGTN